MDDRKRLNLTLSPKMFGDIERLAGYWGCSPTSVAHMGLALLLAQNHGLIAELRATKEQDNDD